MMLTTKISHYHLWLSQECSVYVCRDMFILLFSLITSIASKFIRFNLNVSDLLLNFYTLIYTLRDTTELSFQIRVGCWVCVVSFVYFSLLSVLYYGWNRNHSRRQGRNIVHVYCIRKYNDYVCGVLNDKKRNLCGDVHSFQIRF